MPRYSHAIVSRIPTTLAVDAGGEKQVSLGYGVDLGRARKDQEAFCESLREAGVSVIELAPEENGAASSLFVEDTAIVVHGTALICNPQHLSRRKEIATVLQDSGLRVHEMPVDDKIMLEASDILFTGREFFVGLTKWTNEAGASIVAETFPEFSVTPVQVTGQKHLKYYISLAGPDILSVGGSREAQNILKRIEREATFRYQTLTLPHDEAVNCLNVNGYVLFRAEFKDCEYKYQSLQDVSPSPVSLAELCKLGGLLSQHCILFHHFKLIKKLL